MSSTFPGAFMVGVALLASCGCRPVSPTTNGDLHADGDLAGGDMASPDDGDVDDDSGESDMAASGDLDFEDDPGESDMAASGDLDFEDDPVEGDSLAQPEPSPDPGDPRPLPGIPLSTSTTLLAYTPWKGAPKACESPRKLLRAVARHVNSDWKESGCSAQNIRIEATQQRELVVTCVLAGAATCKNIYQARIWSKWDAAGESGKYEIVGLSRLEKVCRSSPDKPDPSYEADDAARELVSESSTSLPTLLEDMCGEEFD